ncbi:cytochrome c biogenesis CcdA family protein [Actinomadura sp. HBU206391]|uniref:cytochrome c biogenesis CcdA family protein n=1 Tax=Actinomadura sp. HBU206391 TaxID=2731692 RepID=UPI00165025FC|nr:cytochrome c biogenesis CcdA family protein [Actinomadura sp. HBU206391]MBC6459438.1 cytochrome c biogenesis protein CcdA [Actinomadura sp. HBU206391]
MDEIPLALAAGLVAAFNPCGFALLPSYLALLVADPGAGGVWRALRLSTLMTAGFVTVFGVFGFVVSALTASAHEYLPWMTVVVGIALTALGARLLTGRELLLPLPRLRTGGPSGSLAALYGYGASYAVASLSCTVAPFLAVTGIASGSGNVLDGLSAFVAYGVGMGLVVGLLSMMVALARQAAVARLRRLLPHVSRVSGALLFVAGIYVAYYGWYEWRVNSGAPADDPIVAAATELQGTVSGWLERIGIGWVAAAFAVLVLAAAATARARAVSRARRARSVPGDGDTEIGEHLRPEESR